MGKIINTYIHIAGPKIKPDQQKISLIWRASLSAVNRFKNFYLRNLSFMRIYAFSGTSSSPLGYLNIGRTRKQLEENLPLDRSTFIKKHFYGVIKLFAEQHRLRAVLPLVSGDSVSPPEFERISKRSFHNHQHFK